MEELERKQPETPKERLYNAGSLALPSEYKPLFQRRYHAAFVVNQSYTELDQTVRKKLEEKVSQLNTAVVPLSFSELCNLLWVVCAREHPVNQGPQQKVTLLSLRNVFKLTLTKLLINRRF